MGEVKIQSISEGGGETPNYENSTFDWLHLQQGARVRLTALKCSKVTVVWGEVEGG